jgi:hypothetical protein
MVVVWVQLLRIFREGLPRRPHWRAYRADDRGVIRIRVFGPLSAEDRTRVEDLFDRFAPMTLRFELEECPAPAADLDALAHRALMSGILGRREDAIAAAAVLHDALLEAGILGPEPSSMMSAALWAEEAYPGVVAEGMMRKLLDDTES